MKVQQLLVGMIAGCALFFFAMALPARAEVVPSKAPGAIQTKKSTAKSNQDKSGQQKKTAEKPARVKKAERKAQPTAAAKTSDAASAPVTKAAVKGKAKVVAGQAAEPKARAEAPPSKKKKARVASVEPATATPKARKASSPKIDGRPVKVKSSRNDALKPATVDKAAATQSEDAAPTEAKVSAKAARGDKAVKLSTKKLGKSKKVASADKKKKKKTSRSASRKAVCDPKLLRFLANASAEPGNAALSQAFRQLGTRYRSGASAPGSGFDCSGLTSFSFAAAGVDLPRSSREQYQMGRKVAMAELSPGDLVFFKRGSRIFHVGIYVTDGQFIHSSLSKGVTVDNLSDDYWRPKFAGARKVID